MNEWRENAKFVLEELKRLNHNIELWAERTNKMYDEADGRLNAIETNQAYMNGKASMVALFVSAVVSIVGGMISFSIKR